MYYDPIDCNLLENIQKISHSLLLFSHLYGMIKTYEMEFRAPCALPSQLWRLQIMQVVIILVTILQLLCGLAVILAVLFQSGKNSGLSDSIGGKVAETFLSRGNAKSFDAKLAKATKWIGAVFIVLTLILNILH